VCPRLAVTAEKFKGVETATGQVLAVVVPSPSCPYWLSPAQYMMSPGRTTQVCWIPRASRVTAGPAADEVDEAVEVAVDVEVAVPVLVERRRSSRLPGRMPAERSHAAVGNSDTLRRDATTHLTPTNALERALRRSPRLLQAVM